MTLKRKLKTFLATAILGIISLPASGAGPLNLILPTSNDAIFNGDGPGFYQYVDRTFEGIRSHPWEGGQYGFVRNPRETSAGIVYTKFHEGVDIKPLYRDARGEPLDTVRTIDDGYVVYVNNAAGHSSYGKYVVVEHWWSGSPFYSLYAHLSAVHVREGQRVRQGDRLGRIGYTGRGLDRRRAHLHFEINMMLNRSFQDWYDRHYRGANRHGIFNGINLAGLDVAALYLSLRIDPKLSIEEFLERQEAFFTVLVPNDGPLDLTHRYRWLQSTKDYWYADSDGIGRINSWEISFTASGLPLKVSATPKEVDRPRVEAVQKVGASYSLYTNKLLTGSRADPQLSSFGQRHMALLLLPGEAKSSGDEFEWRPVQEASLREDRRLAW